MIIHGSMNYTMSGRKMKRAWQTRRTQRRQQMWHWSTTKKTPPYRPEEEQYPSAPLGTPNENETAKNDRPYASSSTHTVAPAYNKGAYQVIGEENIKDIGR
jgi:hypothetical protein